MELPRPRTPKLRSSSLLRAQGPSSQTYPLPTPSCLSPKNLGLHSLLPWTQKFGLTSSLPTPPPPIPAPTPPLHHLTHLRRAGKMEGKRKKRGVRSQRREPPGRSPPGRPCPLWDKHLPIDSDLGGALLREVRAWSQAGRALGFLILALLCRLEEPSAPW